MFWHGCHTFSKMIQDCERWYWSHVSLFKEERLYSLITVGTRNHQKCSALHLWEMMLRELLQRTAELVEFVAQDEAKSSPYSPLLPPGGSELAIWYTVYSFSVVYLSCFLPQLCFSSFAQRNNWWRIYSCKCCKTWATSRRIFPR